MAASLKVFCNAFLDFTLGDEDDDDDDDQLDFCSNKIVEVTVRRDFLLLQLQALVDATTPAQAQAAIRAMNKETSNDEHLMKFLVRAGTVEILWDILAGKPLDENKEENAAILTQKDADPLLQKLIPYYEQRQERLLKKKKRRQSWGIIQS